MANRIADKYIRRSVVMLAATAILCGAVSGAVAQAGGTPAKTSAAAPMLGADGKPLTFDVVSVHENQSPANRVSAPVFGPTADGYRMTNLPMFLVLMTAFVPSQEGVSAFNPNQIQGMPDWFLRTHYDVDARVSEADMARWKDPALQPEMLRAMLQAMLAERFKLVVHRETKEVPVYELRVAKNGPKFKPSAYKDIEEIRQKNSGVNALPGGAVMAHGSARGETIFFGTTMPGLGMLLTENVGRPVVDKTGLTGKYDFTLQLDMPPPPADGQGISPMDAAGIMIVALQEQLGLKLESAKGSVETLKVDHVERPGAN